MRGLRGYKRITTRKSARGFLSSARKLEPARHRRAREDRYGMEKTDEPPAGGSDP